jgi:hypothetical protein
VLLTMTEKAQCNLIFQYHVCTPCIHTQQFRTPSMHLLLYTYPLSHIHKLLLPLLLLELSAAAATSTLFSVQENSYCAGASAFCSRCIISSSCSLTTASSHLTVAVHDAAAVSVCRPMTAVGLAAVSSSDTASVCCSSSTLTP